MKRSDGAIILAIGGLLSAVIGSIDADYSAWAARVMLLANLGVIAVELAWVRGGR